MGRLFHIMGRPHQPGDVEEYEKCRSIILDHTEERDYEPNWAKDHLKGAASD